MRILRHTLLALVIAVPTLTAPALAADAPPTEESVRQLLAMTHISTLMTGTLERFRSTLRAAQEKEFAGRQLNEQQRQILSEMEDKRIAVLKQMLDWQALEPTIIAVYRENFTQHDIDQMMAFYRTPTGQKMIDQQPQIMQRISQFTSERMTAIVPQLQELQRETMRRLNEAGDHSSAADSGPQPPAQ